MAKNKKSFFKRAIFKTLIIANILFALMIVGSLLSHKISPNKLIIFAFLGLAYPILLYINLFFIFLWTILRKRLFLISLIAILLGFNMIQRYFQWNWSRTKTPENTETFTILSFNVQSFGAFFQHQSLNYMDSLTQFTAHIQPDILCFQEYYNDSKMEEDIEQYIKRSLELPNAHINYHLTRGNRHGFGLATFTNFPIIDTGRIANANYLEELPTTNYAIYTDIEIFQNIIRVYNVHLESIRISSEDGIFTSIYAGDADAFKQESKRLFHKFREAFRFRAIQIQPIREHIDASPYPVIVCGDFNDTPASWAYSVMSKNLNDAFVKAGRGTGKTYNGRYPSFRIDYIFLDKNMNVHFFDTPYCEFSDHFPVYAVCSIDNSE
jgi:endonuclease/exonuclease/phosphatase family metal-dependent hydrolase